MHEDSSINVTIAMKGIIQGLSSHNGESSKLMDKEVEDDDSGDESLTDVGEA